MNYQIVVESKAWNCVDIFEGRVHPRWEKEIDFDILEYQVRNEKDKVVFRSDDEDAVMSFVLGGDSNALIAD